MSEAFFWKTAEPVYRERLSLITLLWIQQLASLVPRSLKLVKIRARD